MTHHRVCDVVQRLSRNAEAVCRHYLSHGRRQGAYWLVGDVHNTPGRSMFVRLSGREFGKGAAGKWTDAATGEHGDLLDVIREACGLTRFLDVVDEARRFLSLPKPEMHPRSDRAGPASARTRSPTHAARRLFAMSQPIDGTIAASYLCQRGITSLHETTSLRFHSNCIFRPDTHAPAEAWPAMVAAVTDLDGRITGVHRTWLHPKGRGKAPVDTPRRAMGDLHGHGVRFGVANDVMAAGEGIETVLSLRMVLPRLPMVAALSAAHLAAILFPAMLRRLYIAQDNDPAGEAAAHRLAERAKLAGVEAVALLPALGDYNDDLRSLGVDALRAAVRVAIVPEDVARFMAL